MQMRDQYFCRHRKLRRGGPGDEAAARGWRGVSVLETNLGSLSFGGERIGRRRTLDRQCDDLIAPQQHQPQHAPFLPLQAAGHSIGPLRSGRRMCHAHINALPAQCSWSRTDSRQMQQERRPGLTSSSESPFLGGSFRYSSASPSTKFKCRSKAMNLHIRREIVRPCEKLRARVHTQKCGPR